MKSRYAIYRASNPGQRRISRLQKTTHNENERMPENYSELVSNTETTFAGNPIKAAKRKRLLSKERLNSSNMCEMVETLKGCSETLKMKINEKMKHGAKGNNQRNKSQDSSVMAKRQPPEVKKPVKVRKGLNVVRLKTIKK